MGGVTQRCRLALWREGLIRGAYRKITLVLYHPHTDFHLSQFNHVNNLQLIARAHQLVNEGYKYHFQSQEVVTVWSAPNYCYRCGNVASIMTLGEDLEPDFKIFSAVPDHRRAVPAGRRGAGEYFL
jgi:hypothetical protein